MSGLSKELHPIIVEDIAGIDSKLPDWQRFSGKTILISGANGFIPAYFVYYFLFLNDSKKINCKVIGIVRDKEKAKRKFKTLLDREDFDLIVADLNEPLSFKEHVDFIIHAASQASPKYYGVDPVGTANTNIFGTANLLKIADESKVESFLFLSGGEIYGQLSPEQIPTQEDQYGYLDPLSVRSCYAESKRMGENLCACWHFQKGVPAKIARLYHTYGPGLRLDDGRVYADFLSDVVNKRDIVMKSDGEARRMFCYISDAVEALLRILLLGENGQAYNVANTDAEMSILELANVISQIDPDGRIKVIRKDSASDPGYIKSPQHGHYPDINRIKKLGWKPEITVREGFSRTIKTYQ
jgi:UDP-glucuronate decarboxylase